MSARGHLPRPITSTLSFRLQGAREKGQGGHTTAVPLPGGHHLPLPKLTEPRAATPQGSPAPCLSQGHVTRQHGRRLQHLPDHTGSLLVASW